MDRNSLVYPWETARFEEEDGVGWKVSHPEGFYFLSDDLLSLNDEAVQEIQPHGLSASQNIVQGMALVKSKVWNSWQRKLPAVYLVTEAEYIKISDMEPSKAERFTVLSIEREIDEALRLTFLDRALKTLEAFYDSWVKNNGRPLVLPFVTYFSGGGFELKRDNPWSSGAKNWLTYGCNNLQTYEVIGYLVAEKYLQSTEAHKFPPGGGASLGLYTGFEPTPKGSEQVGKMKSGGDPTLKDVFFIRRYSAELDTFIKPLLPKIEQVAQCVIRPIWEHHHNRKIDEEILRHIRESPVSLLHVDGRNFNVGLEAGYALALGKPLVAFREAPKEGTAFAEKQLPFDIRTLNVYDYDPAAPEELVRILSERVMAAFHELAVK